VALLLRTCEGAGQTVTVTEVALRPIDDQDRSVLDKFWQLYKHDLSEFRNSHPDKSGLFGDERLLTFFGDADRVAYLMYGAERPVGFAFVRGLDAPARVVAEFFVVRSVRRTGIGLKAAQQLLQLHPGQWEIPFQEENPGAARFWRAVAASVTSGNFHEERRQDPERSFIPPDVWITLTV
jgi:predicted acetyltransferase